MGRLGSQPCIGCQPVCYALWRHWLDKQTLFCATLLRLLPVCRMPARLPVVLHPSTYDFLCPSTLQGEYDEMRLKAAALLRAVGMCDGGNGGPAAVDES